MQKWSGVMPAMLPWPSFSGSSVYISVIRTPGEGGSLRNAHGALLDFEPKTVRCSCAVQFAPFAPRFCFPCPSSLARHTQKGHERRRVASMTVGGSFPSLVTIPRGRKRPRNNKMRSSTDASSMSVSTEIRLESSSRLVLAGWCLPWGTRRPRNV